MFKLYHKFLILLIIFFISTHVHSSQFQNTIRGGIAFAAGDWSAAMRPGVTISFEPLTKINKYFGIGGMIDYTWITLDNPSGADERGGFHLWGIDVVPKVIIPLQSNFEFYLDFDPGLSVNLFYARNNYSSYQDFNLAFELALKTGFNFNQFNFGFKFKSAFIDGISVKWVGLSIGYIGN